MKFYRILGFIGAFGILSFTGPAFAAPNTDKLDADRYRYRLTITTDSGSEHKMKIIGWSHEIVAPRDAASGLPTGKRQHKPFTVTKAVDKSSPLLLSGLTQNENITSWRLEFWRPSRAGKEQQLYKTVTLTTAGIVGVLNESPHQRGSYHVEREHVSFVYRKIKWAYHLTGVVIEDEWQDEDR